MLCPFQFEPKPFGGLAGFIRIPSLGSRGSAVGTVCLPGPSSSCMALGPSHSSPGVRVFRAKATVGDAGDGSGHREALVVGGRFAMLFAPAKGNMFAVLVENEDHTNTGYKLSLQRGGALPNGLDNCLCSYLALIEVD